MKALPNNLAGSLTTTARHAAIDRNRHDRRRFEKDDEAVLMAGATRDERAELDDMVGLVVPDRLDAVPARE